MTPGESTDSGRVTACVEALVDLFNHHEPDRDDCDPELVCSNPEHLATEVLASDWLADVVAQAKAEAWDEGVIAGYRRQNSTVWDLNPYRVESEATS